MRAVIDGRVVLDVMQSIQTDHKLSSYTLNYVSERFLGERKEDVHHSMIAKLHRGDRNTRQRLAAYCLKDAQLPLALKLSANSVYGFTGATVGKLPCLAISASTTAFGRRMIDETRSFVLREYTVANGYPHDADVVYGDTDSVMVRFGCADVAEAMRLGALAADRVTTLFPAPVQLEFEKVYHPYLLMGKKRYAGLLWTRADSPDKLDTKGIETVRRDNCAFARNTIAGVLRRVLVLRDVPGSVEYVKGRIEELLTGRVDISELVITKGLTREVSEYATRAAHVELAAKRRRRHAATAPRVGDRVPYVILRGHKTSKTYELAEDPAQTLVVVAVRASLGLQLLALLVFGQLL
ncbi:DNA polymerase delta catalytic subunit [Cymbomonas tetramitiformis]|uniref:DNA-directed DNA polymerase n=1 Tax=Cymbomonas tetramitiformis TaxID=36881 RepID=A0AAE0KWL2_9CHLO|nr:DNA polymerase delta catalytic subunit [Cymbomonas tetramitiformis]